jgi:tripeptide aminopeptidase
LNQFMVNRERLVNNFKTLSAIDGIHGNEINIANELIFQLTQLGLEVKMDDAGKSFDGNAGNLRAFLPGNSDAAPIFLCAHIDTIQSTKNLKHIQVDGIIKTDGTTILGGDDRAGVAVVMEILNVIKDHSLKHGPIEVIFTVCEEAGMHGAKYLNPSELNASYGFIFDCQASPGNYIIEAPGAYSFKVVVHGCSAHAAVSPEKGVHAIQIASKAIAQLKLGRWAETGMLNIGTIHGGTSINVIPDYVEITGETRNANESELEEQKQYIQNIFEKTAAEMNGAIDLEFTKKYGGYQFKGDEPVVQVARKGISEAGFEPVPIKYPGGSDANVFNNKGVPTINLGVGFKNAHSFQEYIEIKNLVSAANIGLNIVKVCTTETIKV